MARQAKKQSSGEAVVEQNSSEKERSGTAREAPSTNEEREAQASDVGVQPAAPNDPAASEGAGGAAVPPGRAAWLALQELGEEEARRRYPQTVTALRAWAEQAGSSEAIEAGPTARIAARREGFRRCGIAHPKAATDHPAERFTPDELERLLSEPGLRVELV